MQTNQLQKMEFEIVQSSDGNSMYVDIGLPSLAARATIGRLGMGRGYCDTEILDTETQETVYWQHQELDSSTELSSVLTQFFEKLHDTLSSTSALASSFELPLSDKSVSLNALLWPLLIAAAGR